MTKAELLALPATLVDDLETINLTVTNLERAANGSND